MDQQQVGSVKRSRWAAVGAALAVAVGSGGLMSASADIGSGERPVFVSITPCRVADTRPTETVGPRNTPLTANETYAFMVRGSNGNCTIPTDAVGVAVNVAAVLPTASSFFTLFPSDAPRPLSANLNFVGGQPPVSNSASIRLSADGRMSIYNLAGTVHFTLDITGYYVSHHHDDLYYTEAEVDAKQWGSANITDGAVASADLDAELNQLIPVAVIHVTATGVLESEVHRPPMTGAPIATRAALGIYDVSFPGITFFFSTDAANCTSADGSPRIVSVNSIGGANLRVFVFDAAGAAVDGAFYCTIHDLG